jgi:signal transduction histidine kinase
MQGQGTIEVRLQPVGDRCRVIVRDAGPGIPPEVREKIFTPFFTTKARGTGLGLPTARRIVEVHGGTIDIHCPPGGGTVVELELPLLNQAAAADPAT